MNHKYFFMYFIFSFSTMSMEGFNLFDSYPEDEFLENVMQPPQNQAANDSAFNGQPFFPSAQAYTDAPRIRRIFADVLLHIAEFKNTQASILINSNVSLKQQLQTLLFNAEQQSRLLESFYNDLLVYENNQPVNNSYNNQYNAPIQLIQQQQMVPPNYIHPANIVNATNNQLLPQQQYVSNAPNSEHNYHPYAEMNQQQFQQAHYLPSAQSLAMPHTSAHTVVINNLAYQPTRDEDKALAIHTNTSKKRKVEEAIRPSGANKRKKGIEMLRKNNGQESLAINYNLLELMRLVSSGKDIPWKMDIDKLGNKWFGKMIENDNVFVHFGTDDLPVFIVKITNDDHDAADSCRRNCQTAVIAKVEFKSPHPHSPSIPLILPERIIYGGLIVVFEEDKQKYLLLVPKLEGTKVPSFKNLLKGGT